MMKSSSKTKLGAIGVFLVALFVLINVTGFSKNIRGFFYSFSSPIQKNMWAAGSDISSYFTGIFKRSSLQSENAQLQEQNSQLLLQVAALRQLEEENQSLKGAMNIGLDKEFRIFLVHTVAKDANKDAIFINKGARDGLSTGQPVITSQKVLVGKITEVYDKYAKVELITNESVSFGVRIVSADSSSTESSQGGVLGMASGAGDLKMTLSQIPQTQEIQQGDIALSTDLGGIFPGGLLVGQIENIKKNDTESFQTADIKPAFDLNEINDLFVIVN